jgi:hypothetical protein
VSPYPSIEVNTVGGVTDRADALGDRLALPGEALVLLVSRCHLLLHLLQTRCPLWRAARAARCRLVVGVVEALLPLRERLFRLGGSLGGSLLCGGHRG